MGSGNEIGAVRGYRVFLDLFKPPIGEKLVGKREFNNTIDKHAVKVDQPVGHLPRKFAQIVWYFLAHSGEISVDWRSRVGFRTVLKILTNGSFRNQRQVLLCLIFIY